MNQPTREEFEAFKQEIRQEVKQLKEQRTEEIKAVRVDVHNVDVEAIKQALDERSNTWLNTLQQNYTEHNNAMVEMEERIVDRVEALLIKYLKPSTNGH